MQYLTKNEQFKSTPCTVRQGVFHWKLAMWSLNCTK